MSSELRGELTELAIGPERIHAIPNGVDTNRFHPLSSEERLQLRRRLGLSSGKVVVAVGLVSQRKGSDLLASAWVSVVPSHPSAQLVFVGPTEHPMLPGEANTGEVRQILEAGGCHGSVLFAGKSSEVIQYLQAADVFVLSSRREGLPNVLLEAMACGTCCLVSRIGAVESVISPGTDSLAFEPGDSRMLAEKLSALLADDSMRGALACAARLTVERSFSIEGVAKRYVALYQQLVGRGAGEV